MRDPGQDSRIRHYGARGENKVSNSLLYQYNVWLQAATKSYAILQQ